MTPRSVSFEFIVAVADCVIVVMNLYPLTAWVFVARLSTRTSYSPSSASVVARAVTIAASEDVASFCAKISIEGIAKLESVTFSIIVRNDEKNDLILPKVSCKDSTLVFSASYSSTLASLSDTSDSTHDEVSNPDANPLNEILILVFPSLGYIYFIFSRRLLYKTGYGVSFERKGTGRHPIPAPNT